MTPPFTSEESRVWLQTRRLLMRRIRPTVDDLESSAPREQVRAWMADEVDRYHRVGQLFKAQGMK